MRLVADTEKTVPPMLVSMETKKKKSSPPQMTKKNLVGSGLAVGQKLIQKRW